MSLIGGILTKGTNELTYKTEIVADIENLWCQGWGRVKLGDWD